MEYPSKQVLKNFYGALFSGKLSKAEEILKRIQKRYNFKDGDGYYKALYGIYYVYLSDDRDSYLFNLLRKYFEGGESKESLKKSLKELLETSHEPPSDFINAWLDLIDLLDSLPKPHKL
ncbi:MAG: hypothetical protein N3F65_00410 [Nitrososphaeria archaeon]|nr:hypothetical protein [Aigarchaeota archaeon]MCX8187061.1 hypothetical protein [Nitrososphaeria archaeon]MDW8021639.1 hypothetical protein [Nitrososphaerota archaeon]